MAPHWTGLIIIAILVLLLFGGRGKISSLMGDFAKGITAFRTGLKDGEEPRKDEARPRPTLADDAAPAEARRDPRPEDERAGS